MPSSLAIGDFSRATHLNIKTLRHYHRIGLLEPARCRPGTGHRRYGTDQIPTAQVIRRFRSLDMPLEEIQAVITHHGPGGPERADRQSPRAPRGHVGSHPGGCGIAARPARATDRRDTGGHRASPDAWPRPAAAVSEVIDVREATRLVPRCARRAARHPGGAEDRTRRARQVPSTPTISLPTSAAKPPSSCLAMSRFGKPDG